MNGKRLDAWCRGVAPAEAWVFAAPHLAAAGFEGPALAEGTTAPSEWDEAPWGRLRLGAEPVYLDLSPGTEGCLVLSILLRARGGHAAVPALWDALLRSPPRWLGECVVQDRTADVYPLLIHSFSRLQPTVLVVEDDSGSRRRLVARDDDYWAEMGRRRHFLADWLLAEEGTPGASDLAASLGAGLARVDGGVVLDCGWTARPRRLPRPSR